MVISDGTEPAIESVETGGRILADYDESACRSGEGIDA
jgi:hypothetical protein